MKKAFWLFLGVSLCFLFVASGRSFGEEGTGSTNAVAGTEIQTDREQIKNEKLGMKEHGKEAKAEEKALREQIKAAKAAGDTQKAAALKAQLKTLHKQNVAQRKSDKAGLKEARKELRSDKRKAHRRTA